MDIVTKSKIKFVYDTQDGNQDNVKATTNEWVHLHDYIDSDQLETDFGGDYPFQYDLATYWRCLLDSTGNPYEVIDYWSFASHAMPTDYSNTLNKAIRPIINQDFESEFEIFQYLPHEWMFFILSLLFLLNFNLYYLLLAFFFIIFIILFTSRQRSV